jgi:hypothetical protein
VLDAMISNDPSQIYNVVKMAQAGGSQTNIEDAVSISLYGMRTHTRTDLQVQSSEDVTNAAEYVLSQYGEIQLRVEQMRVDLDDSTDRATWRQLLELEMLQRTRLAYVTTDGRSVERDGLVRGYRLQISSRSWSWEVSTGQIPDRQGEFTLDDSEKGVISRWADGDDILLARQWEQMVAALGEANALVRWMLGDIGGTPPGTNWDPVVLDWYTGTGSFATAGAFNDRTRFVIYQNINNGVVYPPLTGDVPVNTGEPMYPDNTGTVNVPTLLDRYPRLAAF